MKKEVPMSLIEKEFKNGDNHYWFYRKEKKNLHNIDNLYYTVMLANDFTEPTDPAVHEFKLWLNALKTRLLESANSFDDDNITRVDIPGIDNVYYCLNSFAHMYQHCLSCPDFFDIFIATTTPNELTPQITVQIRSTHLWLDGVHSCFNKSYDVVEKLCSYFHLTINEVNENRCDFAFHTNYLSSPEKYLSIENFSNMQVSHFRGCTYHYSFNSNDEYENDYIALGKRGDKCFIRMYLKTKEVVEQGYKPFFIQLWFWHNMISRYDKYVLENCFDLKNWKVRDLIRLQFYYDYGSSKQYKEKCYQAMESYFSKGSCNWDYVSKLADYLTPRLTTIMNVEFQVMRKMSKSFCLIDLHPDDSPRHRVDMYLDNHELITDYLTNSVLRLVDRKTALKKSNCTNTAFWESIRRTKMVDVKKKNKNCPQLLRDYSREQNLELIKNAFIHKAVTLQIYANGTGYDKDIHETIADTLCLLNDNDVKHAQRYRNKISYRYNDMKEGFDNAFK